MSVSTAPPTELRVLVADDDPLARRLVREQLTTAEDVSVIGEARDGVEAVRMARDLAPDLVVMDLQMPGCDGIAAAEQITAEAPWVNVVILSVAGDEELVLLALRSGAVGFLDKGIEMEALIRAVHGVGRGEAAIDRTMTRRLIAEFRSITAKAAMRSASRTQASGSELSPREKQILVLLAEGLSTEAMSSELGLAIETVRTHIKSILRKLRVHSRQEAVEVARSTRGVAGGAGQPRLDEIGPMLGDVHSG